MSTTETIDGTLASALALVRTRAGKGRAVLGGLKRELYADVVATAV